MLFICVTIVLQAVRDSSLSPDTLLRLSLGRYGTQTNQKKKRDAIICECGMLDYELFLVTLRLNPQ